MYLAGIAVLCGVLSYFSKKFLANLKKGLFILCVIFALAAGYELITGKSIINLPGSVNEKLNKAPENPEINRHYYKSNEERFGDSMPDNN